MGGKKNKRNRRKQKQIRAESERAEGPSTFDEGPTEAAGPSRPEGHGSTEPPRREAESGTAVDYGIPQTSAQSFDDLYGSMDESQNIISETLQLLKSKDAEANDLSEMLTNAMHIWLKDMLKKVEIVNAEISATRDLVLPTCAILYKLKSMQSEAEEISKFIHSILNKVENMVKQIPAATAVIDVVMEQIDLLQKEGSSMPSSRQLGEIREESSSSAEPHTQENTLVASLSDPESDTLNEQSLQESIVAIPSDDEQMGEDREAQYAEGNSQDPEISEEMLLVMKTKDEEIDGFKDLLTNLMKYRVKDMIKKIDLVTTEAEVTRNLVIYASDVIESLKKKKTVQVDELKALVSVLFRKVDYIMYQVSAATKIVDYTVEQISQLEETEDFRNEIYRSSIYDVAALLDSSNEAQPEADNLMKRSPAADLETAVGGLHLQDSTEHSHSREKSGLKRRSRSGDMADESYLAEEHMRRNSSVSSDDLQEVLYVFEEETSLELLSPAKENKPEYPESLETGEVMTKACSSDFVVQDYFKERSESFETADDFGLEIESNEFGRDFDNLKYTEEYKESGCEQINSTKDEGKELTAEQEGDYQDSSDEDAITEDTGIEGIWLFKLDRRG